METDPETRWTIAVFVCVFLTGLSVQVRGAVLPALGETFRVGPGTLGLVTSAFTLGFGAALLAAGLALGRGNSRRLFGGGVALAGVGLFAVAAAPTMAALLVTMLVRGVGTGLFRGVDRPVLNHLHAEDRGRVLTLQTATWAVGATLGPVAATLALAAGPLMGVAGWRLAYGLLGVAFLLALGLLVGLNEPPGMERETPLSLSALAGLLRRRVVLGACAALVLSGGIESLFFTWLPYYASQFLPRATANLALSAFLLAYVPGRLVQTRLAERYAYTDILAGTATLGVLASAVAFSVTDAGALLAAVFATGLLVSGLFPATIAWALDAVPSYSGPVNALGMVSAQVGFLTFPPAFGLLAGRVGAVAAGDAIPLVVAAYLAVSLVNRELARRARADETPGSL